MYSLNLPIEDAGFDHYNVGKVISDLQNFGIVDANDRRELTPIGMVATGLDLDPRVSGFLLTWLQSHVHGNFSVLVIATIINEYRPNSRIEDKVRIPEDENTIKALIRAVQSYLENPSVTRVRPRLQTKTTLYDLRFEGGGKDFIERANLTGIGSTYVKIMTKIFDLYNSLCSIYTITLRKVEPRILDYIEKSLIRIWKQTDGKIIFRQHKSEGRGESMPVMTQTFYTNVIDVGRPAYLRPVAQAPDNISTVPSKDTKPSGWTTMFQNMSPLSPEQRSRLPTTSSIPDSMPPSETKTSPTESVSEPVSVPSPDTSVAPNAET